MWWNLYDLDKDEYSKKGWFAPHYTTLRFLNPTDARDYKSNSNDVPSVPIIFLILRNRP